MKKESKNREVTSAVPAGETKKTSEMSVPELVVRCKAAHAEFLEASRLLHIAFQQVGLDDATMRLINEGRRLVAQAEDDSIPF